MDAVPVSLEEAARVDGANSIQVLKNVIIPLMKPGILTVLIYVFTGAWGNFFTPFFYCSPRRNIRQQSEFISILMMVVSLSMENWQRTLWFICCPALCCMRLHRNLCHRALL